MDRIIKAIEAQKSAGGGTKSALRWPLLIVLVLVGIAVAAYVSWSQSREIARLRHEKFKQGVLAAQESMHARLATNDKDKAAHEEKADKARVRAMEAGLMLLAAENRYAKHGDAIDRLTWADLPRGK